MAAQVVCESLTNLWNFYFMCQSAYDRGKTGALSNTYCILFGDVCYLPVELTTLIMQVTAKYKFCNLQVALIDGIDFLLFTTPWFLSTSVLAGKQCTLLLIGCNQAAAWYQETLVVLL